MPVSKAALLLTLANNLHDVCDSCAEERTDSAARTGAAYSDKKASEAPGSGKEAMDDV